MRNNFSKYIFMVALFVLYPFLIFSQTTYQNFGITESKYEFNSDWDIAINDVFGSEYRLADWNDLKKYHEEGHDVLELFRKLGITSFRHGVYISKDGESAYDEKRSYIAFRYNHQKPLSGMVHDQIDNYAIVLSSWFSDKQILVYSKNPIKYASKTEIAAKLDKEMAEKREAEKSEITKLVQKVFAYRHTDVKLYFLLIPGFIFGLISHFWRSLESIVFNTETFDNNIPKLALSWGMLFGVSAGLWPNSIYAFLNDLTFNPTGKGFIVWVLYLYAIVIVFLFIKLALKTIFKHPIKGIIRIVLTIILCVASICFGAILFHLFVLWLKKVFGAIVVLYLIYAILTGNSNSGNGPDFILKDRYGNTFKGYFS